MPSAVEDAVHTYIRAWSERDPARRTALIEACFAVDGRMVTRSREIRGRDALAAEMARTHADPEHLGIRVTSNIDASGTTFRFSAVADRRDGSRPESFDAGEVDSQGLISVLFTFAGPLGEANEPPASKTSER